MYSRSMMKLWIVLMNSRSMKKFSIDKKFSADEKCSIDKNFSNDKKILDRQRKVIDRLLDL